jgi:hypothetical protein
LSGCADISGKMKYVEKRNIFQEKGNIVRLWSVALK